jgi:hypothetical protein
MVRAQKTRAVVLGAALSVFGASCGGEGGGGGSPTAPDTRSLTLTASPGSIAVNEESIVTAQARTASGAALAGALVGFSTQLGQLDATARTTDSQGRALVRLRGAGQSGTATVRAQLEGTGITAAVNVRVGIGARVTLVASPLSISVTGGVSLLEARVERLDGQPTAAGTPVEFTASLGRLEDQRPATDSVGVARTRLLADGRTGTARITATTAGADAPATADVVIGPALQITLRATPTRIAASGAATITAVIALAGGSAPPSGTEVALATTLGRLDATRLFTDSSGIATTTLRGEGVRGTARVTATVAGASPASIDVPFD